MCNGRCSLQQVARYLSHALGHLRFQQHSEALCRPSLRPSVRLNTLRAPAEDILQRLREELCSRLPSTEAAAAAASTAPGLARSVFLHPRVPATAIVPGLGPTQPDYSVCEGREVVVSRHAAEAVLKGAHVYAPGLLAATPGIQEGDLVAVSAALDLPGKHRPGITRGTSLTSASAERLPGLGSRGSLCVGVGRAAAGRAGLFRNQRGLSVEMLPQGRVFSLPPLSGVLRGEAVPQALPCIVAAHELAPAPGSRVLDMCAAPGGKTTALAQAMGDSGEVVALDRTRAKVREVESLVADLGLRSVRAYVADATLLYQAAPPPGTRTGCGSGRVDGAGAAADEAPHSGGEAAVGSGASVASADAGVVASLRRPEGFDYVLLDPPCSALGLRPRLQLEWTLPQLTRLAAYQRALLHSAVHVLKPGGVLVYCTCTINPGENEDNVAYALAKWPQLQLTRQRLRMGSPGLVGSLSSDVPGLTPSQAALVQRFDPGGDEDTIGFFIATFIKIGSTLAM